MPRPPIDLHQSVRGVLQHASPSISVPECPISQFEQLANTGESLIKYIDEHIDPNDVYPAVYDRHLGHLRRMVLAELIESFERFVKEVAAECIDHLAPYSADDRFDEFKPRGDRIAAFVNARSIGRCDLRIGHVAAKPHDQRSVSRPFEEPVWRPMGASISPRKSAPGRRASACEDSFDPLADTPYPWHNVGVVTHSDAVKFRLLIGGGVPADCRLAPTADDLRYANRFLIETARHTNERVGRRLAELLTSFHQGDAGFFNAQEKADQLSQKFAQSLTVNGHAGAV